jgi:hypothetical protein
MSTKELIPRRIYDISEERVEQYLLNIQNRYFDVVAENLELRQQVTQLINNQNKILRTLENNLLHLTEQKQDSHRLEMQIQKLGKDLFQYLSLENRNGSASETEDEMRYRLKKLFLDKMLEK